MTPLINGTLYSSGRNSLRFTMASVWEENHMNGGVLGDTRGVFSTMGFCRTSYNSCVQDSASGSRVGYSSQMYKPHLFRRCPIGLVHLSEFEFTAKWAMSTGNTHTLFIQSQPSEVLLRHGMERKWGTTYLHCY
jgi:hypothetical protein